MENTNETIIRLENIGKSFGATRALESVSFDFKKSDITAIVGANGAGKSTLIKIICGYHISYDGKIFIDGELAKFSSPDDAHNKGIETVHQIINDGIISNMTVAENLVLKDMLMDKSRIFFNKKNYIDKAKDIADLVGLNRDMLNKEVSWLSQSERQLVIIARALSSNPKLLILDEPTAALSERETEILFEKLMMLKEKGVTILYVSHRLHEIKRIADTVVVIRDGVVSKILPKPFEVNQVVTAMVGNLNAHATKSQINFEENEILLEVKDLVCYKGAKPINFSIRKGEIVSMVGLIGAGKTEFGEVLFGIKKPISGSIYLNGKKIISKNIRDAVNSGIFFIPEDRSNNAVFPNFNIVENITIPFLKVFSPKIIMDKKKEKSVVSDIITSLSLKYESIDAMMDSLSGGNQQKVVVSRWLFQKFNLIILDEPFQGVDIKSRFDIGQYMKENIGDGAALVLVADLDEAIEVANRIVILNSGMIVFNEANTNLDKDKLIHLMSDDMDELKNEKQHTMSVI